ncbi:MAG: flagellar basal body rod protein FlgC [Mahellales bacterium]
MGVFSAIDISASGLTAQRFRMDLISQNIANVNTINASNGQPYRRRVAVFQEHNTGGSFNTLLSGNSIGNTGVRVAAVVEDTRPFKRIYEPGHPHADDQGYVELPNVDILNEMVDMLSATRSYEANITAVNAYKSMCLKTLEIGR